MTITRYSNHPGYFTKAKYHRLLLIPVVLFAATILGCGQQYAAPIPPAPNQVPAAPTTPVQDQRLPKLYDLAHSQEYNNVLAEINKVQADSGQLEAFIEGLPKLPSLLQYVTIDDLTTAVELSKKVRGQLSALPSLPSLLPGFPLPPAPAPIKDAVQKLENARQDILAVTEPIAQLPDLPDFINSAGTLEQAKQQLDSYATQLKKLADSDADILQRLKALTEKAGVQLNEFQSLCNSPDYQSLLKNINHASQTNDQLLTLAKSLPELPAALSNISVDKLENAVKKAKQLNTVLSALPQLPPLSSDLVTLETLRHSTIKLTGIVAKLPDLPDFIDGSKKLGEVRIRVNNYLNEVKAALSHSNSILQQINQILAGS